jgi:hypothetical protein
MLHNPLWKSGALDPYYFGKSRLSGQRNTPSNWRHIPQTTPLNPTFTRDNIRHTLADIGGMVGHTLQVTNNERHEHDRF